MEIGSESHEKAGLFARVWWWIKAFPDMFKAKVVDVVNRTKKLGQDDPRRVIHSIKVGLALSLVTLFYYFRPFYKSFGDSAMWAVLTVVVVFEFTVGATLGKGLNRGFATFLAGALGVGVHHLATLAGENGEPIVLSFLVFLLAAASTFSRFFPGIKARYDYGVVIFILTFSLVSVSGYRVNQILELARQRLLTIIIGGSICMIISIFICPVWAGEDLHKLVALNMEKLADFLEGFESEYFEKKGDGERFVVSKLQGYKSVLNSKTTEESLSNFARWEPCHGRFRFCHPWKQYLKIGVLTRQCAYRIEALSGYINSDIQAPPEFKKRIQKATTKMSLESGKALRELASGIRTMTHTSSDNTHMENSKAAANDLKTALKTSLPLNTDLLQVIPAATVASLLVEIVRCTEKIAESVHELARLVEFKTGDPTLSPEKQHLQLLHRGIIKPLQEANGPHVYITVLEPSPAMLEHANPHEPIRRQDI